MNKLFRLVFLTLGVAAPVFASLEEASRLKSMYEVEVGSFSTEVNYWQKAQKYLQSISGGLNGSQYVVLVDRNHKIQKGMLVYVDGTRRQFFLIGEFPVSTGNPNRRGFFETPTGFFLNTPKYMSYRALGTKNSKGWRGLGAKGSRVWDFGWQETKTKKGEPYQIRLLLHATDPEHGEPRLSKIDSKGCVRVSGKVNRFLDRYGILDALYEADRNLRVKAALRKDRAPAPNAGKYMVVWDSEIFEKG